MVALPAFKFVFLAIRQVTRPIAKQIVSRANTQRATTYRVCVGLGRVSLGLSGVISEWTRAEELKQKEAKRKSEEESRAKAAKAAAAHAGDDDVKKRAAAAAMDVASGKGDPTHASASSTTAAAASSTGTAAAAPAPGSTPATVTPRSRSLLQSVVYGPQPKGGPADTYDSSIFLDPSRTVGEAARVFIRYPSQSAWDVFRQTFLAPFPEDRLVAAGADLLIELLAYTILCTLLVVELMQQSRTTAAKEAHLQARLEAIEAKVNELVERNNNAVSTSMVEELPPVPELHVTGRLGALWGAMASGVSLLGDSFAGGRSSSSGGEEKGSGSSASNSRAASSSSSSWVSSGAAAVAALTPEERERLAQSGKAVVPLRVSGSTVAFAPPRDPHVKVSKYDETALLQEELDQLMRNAARIEKRA